MNHLRSKSDLNILKNIMVKEDGRYIVLSLQRVPAAPQSPSPYNTEFTLVVESNKRRHLGTILDIRN